MHRGCQESGEVMKYDIIIAGVGGQGGLSVSVVITQAALESGLKVKQSEVHGMSQRGGEVLAHLRISDQPIASPLIPLGCADLILSFEAIEGLRYLPWLKTEGKLVTSKAVVKNIKNYPDTDLVFAKLAGMENAKVVDSGEIAKKAGNARGANMVLVGSVASLLPVKPELLEKAIMDLFSRKGDDVVQANLKAFEYGRKENS